MGPHIDRLEADHSLRGCGCNAIEGVPVLALMWECPKMRAIFSGVTIIRIGEKSTWFAVHSEPQSRKLATGPYPSLNS